MKLSDEEMLNNDKKIVKIGVGGACGRMGTTTQAIQIVKHLLFCGKKACYIELNSSGYLKQLMEAYTIDDADEKKGKVHFSSVDMYYRQDLIPEVLHMDYEYFVYDYGAFESKDFNKVSFLEKDIKIMVLGSNPGEIQYSTKLLSNIFYQDISYIFNLTAKADRKDLLEMMEEKADRTYFAEYCPDMFIYVPAEYYSELLPKVRPEVKDEKKKKGFFRRKKGA